MKIKDDIYPHIVTTGCTTVKPSLTGFLPKHQDGDDGHSQISYFINECLGFKPPDCMRVKRAVAILC